LHDFAGFSASGTGVAFTSARTRQSTNNQITTAAEKERYLMKVKTRVKSGSSYAVGKVLVLQKYLCNGGAY